jgi:hypothetical protein
VPATLPAKSNFDSVPLVTFCHIANLQCLTGLQRLSIDNTLSQPDFSTDSIKLLAWILDKIPSLTLKYIHFGLCTSSILSSGWHQIGKVLQQSRFSQLTELVFSSSEWTSGYVNERIRKDLSVLEERGIVSFRPKIHDHKVRFALVGSKYFEVQECKA